MGARDLLPKGIGQPAPIADFHTQAKEKLQWTDQPSASPSCFSPWEGRRCAPRKSASSRTSPLRLDPHLARSSRPSPRARSWIGSTSPAPFYTISIYFAGSPVFSVRGDPYSGHALALAVAVSGKRTDLRSVQLRGIAQIGLRWTSFCQTPWKCWYTRTPAPCARFPVLQNPPSPMTLFIQRAARWRDLVERHYMCSRSDGDTWPRCTASIRRVGIGRREKR